MHSRRPSLPLSRAAVPSGRPGRCPRGTNPREERGGAGDGAAVGAEPRFPQPLRRQLHRGCQPPPRGQVRSRRGPEAVPARPRCRQRAGSPSRPVRPRSFQEPYGCPTPVAALVGSPGGGSRSLQGLPAPLREPLGCPDGASVGHGRQWCRRRERPPGGARRKRRAPGGRQCLLSAAGGAGGPGRAGRCRGRGPGRSQAAAGPSRAPHALAQRGPGRGGGTLDRGAAPARSRRRAPSRRYGRAAHPDGAAARAGRGEPGARQRGSVARRGAEHRRGSPRRIPRHWRPPPGRPAAPGGSGGEAAVAARGWGVGRARSASIAEKERSSTGPVAAVAHGGLMEEAGRLLPLPSC